ncbi:MAG: SGNH/GDSL hydrolase family protein [Phycisphaerales bacterium]|nr:SGNH/GDSL hydrolase family protein [Phycisphaerales bacterium]
METTDNIPAGGGAKPRRFGWKLLVLAVILLVVAEAGLRWGAGLGNPVLYQTDSACGYLPVADQRIKRFGCWNIINHFGQRSVDLPAEKTPGHERILFVGDSVTYGTTRVDQSGIFTAILARELPKKLGRPVEIMNASTGAWAVGNEVGYLKSRGLFGADVVVFVLNTGDLVQPFNPGNLTAEGGYPDRRPWCALSELWVRYLAPRLFGRKSAHDAGSTAAGDEKIDVKEVLAKLEEAKSICLAAGAKMAIVYSPCAGKQWQESPYPEYFVKLKQWAGDNGIAMLDLTDAYAKASADEVYFDGTHLRPKGNELAAEGIERGWGILMGNQ